MKRLKPTSILEYILLILLAGLFLFPMIWMVVSAMKPEADVYKNLTSWKAFLPSFNPADWFKPYQEVLSRFSILTYLGNSIFYAGTFALGSIIVNALAGFAFAKILEKSSFTTFLNVSYITGLIPATSFEINNL